VLTLEERIHDAASGGRGTAILARLPRMLPQRADGASAVGQGAPCRRVAAPRHSVTRRRPEARLAAGAVPLPHPGRSSRRQQTVVEADSSSDTETRKGERQLADAVANR
jgi:hypothetical protein